MVQTEVIMSFTGKYRFLSNFYPCTIVFEGIYFPSVEHAYQAAKTLDPEERRLISLCRTAGEAKRRGKMVALRTDWEEIKEDVMWDLLMQKFTRTTLDRWLVEFTGDAQLFEGNWWGDTYWGVDLKTGEGSNRLGKLLMSVRDFLKEEGK